MTQTPTLGGSSGLIDFPEAPPVGAPHKDGGTEPRPPIPHTLRHAKPKQQGRRLTAAWRQPVLRSYENLAMDLVRIGAPADEMGRREVDEMWGLLDEAYDVAANTGASPISWWSGAEPKRAWRCLREVEERLVDLVPEDELDVRAADAMDHASRYGTADGRCSVTHLKALRADRIKAEHPRGDGGQRGGVDAAAAYRPAIRAVLHDAHRDADLRNQNARAFRNRLLLASALLVTGVVAVIVVQVQSPSVWIVPRPDRWSSSAWVLLLAVMVFGLVGALFTAIPSLSRVPTDTSPFNLPLQQSVLKLVFGCVTAVAGLAALGAAPAASGLKVQVTEMTMPTLFLLALALGAGQQTVTRYVDRRARAILTEADSSTNSTTS